MLSSDAQATALTPHSRWLHAEDLGCLLKAIGLDQDLSDMLMFDVGDRMFATA